MIQKEHTNVIWKSLKKKSFS